MQRLVIAWIALASLGCAVEMHGAPPSTQGARWADDTEVAWSEMQRALAGRWRAVTPKNQPIATSYRVVSKGSALVETFTSASGNETISVYHRDGRGLMLTHYCAQGNQARLRATEARPGRVVFQFLDATNVDARQGVMHRLSFVFREDEFDQESVYRSASGEEETTTLHFHREPETK